ncbi:MAG: glycosyltransferase [Bacteroidota bacterium]|nr:glycosyltransferase [Bacteroidota bacterium]
MKRIIVSVINDLVTDQRVDKTCRFLTGQGCRVLLVGRKLKNSLPLEGRPYKMHRMKLIWRKGPLFYAEFNIRLFFFLLVRKSHLLHSNDLDTLLPNYLIHRLKGIPLVYDSHELFTQTPEVINRPFVQNSWKLIEKCIVPRLDRAYTVNASIARIFHFMYKTDFRVVRNIPECKDNIPEGSRNELGLPPDKNIILLQGSGINMQRGAEELVEAMRYLDEHYLLLVIGDGDVIDELKEISRKNELGEKVRFLPKMPFRQLQQYTRQADLGVSIDKDSNPNYRYSLPNKLFDYIHAGVPVMASRLFEIEKIIRQYRIGDFIEDHQPEIIAAKIREMLGNREKLDYWKENLKFAAKELSWQNEQKELKEVYRGYV